MNIKQKTAAVATFANVLLTIFKFFAYSYTGSLAILAEAWHSLSDIATSFLVWLAVRQQKEYPTSCAPSGQPAAEPSPGGSGDGIAPTNFWRKGFNSLRGLLTEEAASLVIGLFLLAVSLGLFHGLMYSQTDQITNPLVAGILFLLFGVLSYGVFQFETRIGLEQNSVGLTSDGLHSKSDMIASFLAGGALIAYHFGFDADRLVGFFIAVLIFFLAVEVIVMSYGNRLVKDLTDSGTSGPLLEFKTHRVLFSVFEAQTWDDFRSFLETRLSSRIDEIPVLGFFFRHGSGLLLVLLAGGYLSTAFFLVGPSERGIIERFGKIHVSAGIYESGIHLKLPWPLETAHLVDTESVRELAIGGVVASGARALIWGREHGDGQPFLAGDNNFLYPYMILFYRIKDPVRFMNIHSQPGELLQRACLRLMTETFTGVTLYSMFTQGRSELVGLLAKRLQEALDRLETGILLENICLKDLHPPISVAPAFEAVVSAEQAKQTMILESYSYQNSEIPHVRAKSDNLVQSAEAYRLTREHIARGESERFRLTEQTYQATKTVTRLRMYLDAVQKALRTAKVILVDRKVDSPALFVNTANLSTSWLSDQKEIGSPEVENPGFSAPLRPFETNQQLIEETLDDGELKGEK